MRLAAALLAVVIAAWGSLAPNAEARTPRIGVLFVGRTDTPRSYELFEALRQLGYVEGESVVYELRTAAGDTAQLAQAAGELIATRPDVIGHRQLVGCDQQCSLAWPANRAISCRGGHAGNLSPDLKGTGPGGSILGGGAVIAAEIKQVIDLIMSGEEALGLAG